MTSAILAANMTIIEPLGHVNAANASEFQRQLTAAVDSATHPVLVDMHQVKTLDSAGLMALVSAVRLAQKRKRRLSLCAIAPSIHMIFELTQLDGSFEIFDSRDAFVATLG